MVLSFKQFIFIACQVEGYRNVETKLQATCFYLIKNFFKKTKEVWNWLPCLVLYIICEKKYFSC